MRKYVKSPKEIDNIKVIQDGQKIKEALLNGETVMHWEYGDSMYPILMSGEYVKLTPITEENCKNLKGKPVFCTFEYDAHGKKDEIAMVHLCTDVHVRNDGTIFCKIETTNGYLYGWTTNVYGIGESTDIFEDS